MPRVYLNRFDGGVVNDPRNPDTNKYRVATNFDALTNPYKLTPYRDSEDGDSAGSTSKKQNFCIALGPSSTYSLHALGVVSGTARAEVLRKFLTTGGATDLDDNGWATPSNNQSGGGTTSFNLFVFYKKTGLIYGAQGNQYIWAFDPTGSAAWANTHNDLTSYTNIAQGLVHSKDDILYVPYDNKIAKNNNGSWSNTALTLPSHLYITSICEYGNYLAIACAPLSGFGKSVVYLWDRDSSLTTLSESIDWGEGNIKVLEEIGGALVGISLSGNDSTRFADKISFKSWTGGSRARLIQELEGGNATSYLLISKQKINDRVYFLMKVTLNGSSREGVWSIGPSSTAIGGFSIVHERTPNNDTAINSAGTKGFFFAGDFLFIGYINANGDNAVSKTNDAASYTATSILETTVNPGMDRLDRPHRKKLKSVGATYEALPISGQVVVKARVDGGTFATYFTETTDSAVRTEPVGVQADGAYTNSTGTEFEFRIESTGGAVVTGLFYEYENILSN